MSPNEVNNLLNDNEKRGYTSGDPGFDDPVNYIMFYIYQSEIINLLNGRLRIGPDTTFQIIGGEYKFDVRYIRYVNNNWKNYNEGGFRFFFENNRLIEVQTVFQHANIIRELETRYGMGTEINLSGLTNSIGKVWLNNNRFIVWINSSDLLFRHIEYVAYMDSNSLRRICQTSLEENRILVTEEQQRARSRIE
jgi:hypothetical protein